MSIKADPDESDGESVTSEDEDGSMSEFDDSLISDPGAVRDPLLATTCEEKPQHTRSSLHSGTVDTSPKWSDHQGADMTPDQPATFPLDPVLAALSAEAESHAQHQFSASDPPTSAAAMLCDIPSMPATESNEPDLSAEGTVCHNGWVANRISTAPDPPRAPACESETSLTNLSELDEASQATNGLPRSKTSSRGLGVLIPVPRDDSTDRSGSPDHSRGATGPAESDQYPFRCGRVGCEASFAHQYHLISHASVHQDSLCPEPDCSKKLHLARELADHMIKAHQKSPHMCRHPSIRDPDEPCGRLFRDSYQLRVHQETYLHPKELKCPIRGCRHMFRRLDTR